jgi:hypothetical protein
MSLNKLFKDVDKVKLPKYFRLDENFDAYYSDESPTEKELNDSETDFNYTVAFPTIKSDITLCTTLGRKIVFPEETKYTNIGFLKSHLQKCIRRRLNDKALKTAYHLFKMSPTDLLRRLSIIMIEDTCLHSSYNTLVWFGIATLSNQFYWTLPHMYKVLTIVNYMCKIPYYDNVPVPNNSRFHFHKNLCSIQEKINEKMLRDTLYSLQFRLDTLGGMPGEVKLQTDMIHQWFLRFTKKSHLDPEKSGKYIALVKKHIKDTDIIDHVPKPLKINEWILEGIDFHCASMLLDWTAQKYPDYSRTDIKKAIWEFRSSINKRTYLREKQPADPELLKIWNKIKYSVDSSCIYILKNYL